MNWIAVLVGVLLKIYDDFVDDDPILTNEHAIAALRTLQIGMTAVLLANDFSLCVVFLLFNAVCAVSSPREYAKPHDVSYVPLVVALLAVSWPTRTAPTRLDGMMAMSVLGAGLMEATLIPEEVSWRKYASRLLAGSLSITMLRSFPSLSPPIMSGLLIWIGYCLTSSTVQMLKVTGLLRSVRNVPF